MPKLTPPRVRFAVIGINHSHIYAMTENLIAGGAELAGFYTADEAWAAAFAAKFPDAPRVDDPRFLLDDPGVALIASAGIPSERAPLGLEVMRRGKDYFCDKAAFLNLEDLGEARRVQAETGRIFAICYSERLLEPGSWKAGGLVRAGAIGRVVHQTILAPHALNPGTRAPWFFQRRHTGGILTDIGSHQVEQFLYYAGLESATIAGAQVSNQCHPEHPEFEDLGELTLHGVTPDGHECGAFIRVDWLIPAGARHNGRHRVLLGTEGFLEMSWDTLRLTTSHGTEEIDCAGTNLDFGRLLVDDVLNRTQTAIGQDHCFYASELTIRAQLLAEKNAVVRSAIPSSKAPPSF